MCALGCVPVFVDEISQAGEQGRNREGPQPEAGHRDGLKRNLILGVSCAILYRETARPGAERAEHAKTAGSKMGDLGELNEAGEDGERHSFFAAKTLISRA